MTIWQKVLARVSLAVCLAGALAGLAIAAEPGWLGLTIQDVAVEQAKSLGWEAPRGTAVLTTNPAGPGAKAGILPGDILVSLDGREIDNSKAFSDAVAAKGAGATVRLRLIRGGKEQSLQVETAAFPQPASTGVAPTPASTEPSALYERANAARLAENFGIAKELYEKAAAGGHAEAMNNLGWLYASAKGVKLDYVEAARWYEKGMAAGGGSWAVGNLARLYRDGSGVKQDYARARQLSEKAALAGNMSSMADIGWMNEMGRGGARDLEKAKYWYEKAAAGGDAYAMNQLGQFYRDGKGVKRDYQAARQWYEKAVSTGNSSGAMVDLGWLHEKALGVPRSYEQARYWYKRAADAGNTLGMTNLGALYANGQGGARDRETARDLYKKAIAAGESSGLAVKNLAILDQPQRVVRGRNARRGGGGGGYSYGGGDDGYVAPKAYEYRPYGHQPSYTNCQSYTLNVDGSKYCF